MAFSTLNSVNKNIVNKIGLTIKPPTNVYVNGVDSSSILYKFTAPTTGVLPQYYEANITADGVNYTVMSNTLSPLSVTGLLSDTSYNGFIYSVFNGKYSTGVAIKGYVMPTNCNTLASTITGISPSTFAVNNYKQGLKTLVKTSQNGYTYSLDTLFYMHSTNFTASIPNINKYMITTAPITIYTKRTLSYTTNTGIFVLALNVTYRNSYLNANKIFGINEYGSDANGINQSYTRNIYYSNTDNSGNFIDTFGGVNSTETRTTELTISNNDIFHSFIIINNGNIKNYIYNSRTSNLVLSFNLTKNYDTAVLLAGIGSNTIKFTFGQNSQSFSSANYDINVYDFRIFDRVLTTQEMINITRNN